MYPDGDSRKEKVIWQVNKNVVTVIKVKVSSHYIV